ncbi:MAG: iron-containing alcohol dehydrogenase [Polyangiales bacterium]
MALTTWSFPTRILFGEGAIEQLGAQAKALGGGGAALIVTDPGVIKAGVIDVVRASLDAAGVPHATFDGVHGNPHEKDVHDGFEAFQKASATLVIAVGGGSPLDVGKLVRLLVTHAPPLAQYDDAIGGDAKIVKPVPPMIAVPTTAGTGSEVGRSGVVTIEATGRKTVIFSPRLMAELAILDPALTTGMPARTTAATGFDALTHNVEAYLSLGDHPMADGIALHGIELCVRWLARAVKAPNDLEARGAMMKAAMMGAVAFQKGLGACHSLAHPLSSEKGLHHGLANALCLPAVVAWNGQTSAERVARVAQIFGVGAEQLPAAIAALRAEIGLPNGLRAEGVADGDLDRLADLAIEDACHRCNPRPCTRADLRALYAASMG